MTNTKHAPCLLSDLDAAYAKDKNPDQIVKSLLGCRWVQGKDFTQELHERWYDKRVILCYKDKATWGLITGQDYDDPSLSFTWDFAAITETLGTYYYILKEDYIEGVFPC